MRNGRILAAVAILAAMVVSGLAPTAWARDAQTYTYASIPAPIINWSKPDSAAVDFDWSDTNNWVDGNVPGIVGGAADTSAQFPQWVISNDVNVKVNEAVDTGTGDIYIRLQSSGGTDMYLNGTGSLKCSTYWVRQGYDYVICQVPLEATTMVKLEWRWGYGRFENTVKTPIVRVGDGDFTFATHTGNDQMDAVQMWKDQDSSIPQMYQYNAIDPYTTGTPLSILIDDGGVYGGYVDGAFGTLTGNSASLIQGSTMIVGAAQTNFPSVEVEGGSVLAGDMTGLTSADFGLAGDGKKVTFAANVIYAPAPGSAEPTRAAMGGAILVKGIYDTSATGTTTVGDDGSTSLYKAAGFGAFGTSTAINTTVAVLPGIGNLPISVTGRNADLGAGTILESVTTKAVDFTVPNGAANVNMVGAINNGDLTGAKATTFNCIGTGNLQHDTILRFLDAGGEIAAGQTFNVQNGLVYLDTGANTTFLKGTLEVDAGAALLNTNTAALSASDGTIHFKDRSMLFLDKNGMEGMFENVNVAESGTPFIVVATNGNGPYTYTIDDGTQMGDLVKASNIWVSATYTSAPTTFAGDGVLLGDGKWMQSVNGYTRSPTVAGIVRADPGTTIGFASMGVDRNGILSISADIEATGATVLFNTTDTLETSVYWATNTSGNHHTNNRDIDSIVPNQPIVVSGEVTAETIKAQNGQVTFQQDLSVPNLDIAGGATVTMASGKTATVTSTLSGTGKWSGGLTVAAGARVAPGASVGILNDGGGALTFDDGAIYQWQVANPAGDPGTEWDLVKASAITFQGDLVMDVDDSLLTIGSIDGTKSFIVATAGSMGVLESYSFLGTWSGTLTVDGGNLILTELSGALPGDADGDGDVDAADYIMVKTHFGGAPAAGTEGSGGDFNETGTVDWDDLQILLTAYSAGTGADTIPEPATLFIMLAAGLPALLKRRRRS